MGIKFESVFGATPIDPDEAEGLIPQSVQTQGELNQCEQENILEAELWLFGKHILVHDVLTIDFLKKLHIKMFGNVWRWAGAFRKSNKNIGVDWPAIMTELKNLLDDVEYQIVHQSFEFEEVAARFHHRLVAIHPFVNGNGRHARLSTDVLLMSQGCDRFSWGSAQLTDVSNTRKQYINALRSADRMDYGPLIHFVKM